MNSCEFRGEKRGYGSSGVTSSYLTTFIYFARRDKLWRDELRLVPNFSFRGSKFGTTQRSSLQCAREMGRILEVAQCTTLAESGARPIWQRHFWDTPLRRDESYNQKWHYVVENPMRAAPCEACVRLALPRRDERAAVVFLNFGTTRRSSLHGSAFRNCTFVE
jgi:hypothetical protein